MLEGRIGALCTGKIPVLVFFTRRSHGGTGLFQGNHLGKVKGENLIPHRAVNEERGVPGFNHREKN